MPLLVSSLQKISAMSDSTAGDLIIFALITCAVFILQPAAILWARKSCNADRQRSAARRRQEVFLYMYAAKPKLGFALDTAEVLVSLVSIVFVIIETFDVCEAELQQMPLPTTSHHTFCRAQVRFSSPWKLHSL